MAAAGSMTLTAYRPYSAEPPFLGTIKARYTWAYGANERPRNFVPLCVEQASNST